MTRVLCIFLLLLGGCSVFEDRSLPEEELLEIFRQELGLIAHHQANYIPYMEHQIAHFDKKSEKTMRAIERINRKFAGMTPEEKRAYQEKWRRHFQPVIDRIYRKTRKMILRHETSATHGELAQFEELTVKINLLERDSPQAHLLPRFFDDPENQETTP